MGRLLLLQSKAETCMHWKSTWKRSTPELRPCCFHASMCVPILAILPLAQTQHAKQTPLSNPAGAHFLHHALTLFAPPPPQPNTTFARAAPAQAIVEFKRILLGGLSGGGGEKDSL